MLRKLIIENYALIERLDIDFPNGLIIITGETGAGKSILLGALSLILGNRADATVIKDQSKNCIVEAEFSINNPILIQTLVDEGFDVSDSIILRRVISANGKSRSFLNDEPIGVRILSSISNKLIDIHAQHQHLLLADKNFQRSLIDEYANIAKEVNIYSNQFAIFQEFKGKLLTLDNNIYQTKADLEYKMFQHKQLVDAKLVIGELELIEQEYKTLAHSEEIKNIICTILEKFQPEGISIGQNLKEASQLIDKLSTFGNNFPPLQARMDSCKIELNDIEAELSRLSENVEVSPLRLQELEDRTSLLYSLQRKFSVNSVSTLIELRDKLESDISMIDNFDSYREEIIAKIALEENKLRDMANSISDKRLGAAVQLTEELVSIIKELEMPYAELEISITKIEEFNQYGCDKIDFYFSANGSKQMLELAKVASGGEMSRISLAIKSLMARFVGMPTMIFDEIDTGVSGRVADKMGNLIGELGKNMQLFAITHLPQIASKGSDHYVVYKEFNDRGEAESKIKRVEAEERVTEVAKLLSGSQLGVAAIENAKELLGN